MYDIVNFTYRDVHTMKHWEGEPEHFWENLFGALKTIRITGSLTVDFAKIVHLFAILVIFANPFFFTPLAVMRQRGPSQVRRRFLPAR